MLYQNNRIPETPPILIVEGWKKESEIWTGKSVSIQSLIGCCGMLENNDEESEDNAGLNVNPYNKVHVYQSPLCASVY